VTICRRGEGGAVPIFGETVEDTFVVFAKTKFPDLERKLAMR
jgi:hypothetical protein